jgi:serine/threonine-protein kinase
VDSDVALREVRATLLRAGLADTELAVGGTILRREPLAARASAQALPSVSIGSNGATADFVLVRQIGRGGMGVVHVAHQRSIDRDVAVKTTATSDTAVARALVREARIMGALEHPSLVPVHLLGRAPDGSLVLVMKRVDGVPWSALLDDSEHAAWAPLLVGHGDRLRANVEVLAQICRALAFAHDRRVVHLDLKPENVMIGRFGEVVLLDWGVALRLDERDAEPDAIVGTPACMAPEMARGDARLVDARTDVYLLGATLFEILTGRAIHAADSAVAAIVLAIRGEVPPLPEDAPPELATLVRRACSSDVDERPATAEDFRARLQHFLATRDTDALVADARAALDRATRAKETEGAASVNLFRALVEARFGLTSALRLRPEDRAIAAELERSVVGLVEREVALRSADAARALLAELTVPPSQLVQSIEALEDALAAERNAAAALAQSKRAADASSAVQPLTLVAVAGLVVGTCMGAWFAIRAAGANEGFPVRVAIAIDVVGLSIAVVGMFLGRRALLATEGTRRLAGFYMVWGWSLAVSDAVSYSFGRDAAEAAAHSMTVSAFVTVCAAVWGLRGVWPSAVVHAATVLAIFAAPKLSAIFAIGALMVDAVVFVRAFRTEGRRSRA